MPLMKFKKPDEVIRQGYPAASTTDNVDLLALDRQWMTTINDNAQLRESPNALLNLEVGKACNELRETAKKKFVDICLPNGALYQLMYDNVLTAAARYKDGAVEVDKKTTSIGDFTLVMPSLKKVPRITEKAVTYATCDEKINSDVPLLERVVDILRGTLVLERDEFLMHDAKDGGPNFGSRIIDVFDKAMGNNLVQVKNRFNDLRKPILYDYTATSYSEALKNPKNHVVSNDMDAQVENEEKREAKFAAANLVNTIATMVNVQLRGRDTFYRDLQLLFKLPNRGIWKNSSRMTHVYFELQITTRTLFDTKSVPVHANDDEKKSGHDEYVKIRRVMEYCELLYWNWKKKSEDNTFKFALDPNLLNKIFPEPRKDDYLSFKDALESMWALYAKNCPKYRGMISRAIEDSKWYANANK